MKKMTQLVLMLYLILSGAWCYASGAARTENVKGNDGVIVLCLAYHKNVLSIIENQNLINHEKNPVVFHSFGCI